MNKYCEYFGFKTEPFTNNISTKNLLKLPDMLATKERLDYTIKLGGLMLVTGDVGSGKSTAIRWALSEYHSSELVVLHVIANSASLGELYKQLCWAIDVEVKTASRAFLFKTFRQTLRDLVLAKKQKVVLVIDEASLLRIDVFSEIHTLTQFEQDSQNLLSMVFVGQPTLLEKLTYRSSAPLASRVIAKSHLKAIKAEQMSDYLQHHLKIAGSKKQLFSEQATTAIHQGSAGILRTANNLARGALIAAAIEKTDLVSAEHVRIASTEIMN
jgi:general secretion pathway protein A